MSEFTTQLVIQFPESIFDRAVKLEDALLSTLDENVAVVDGHDVGSGEANVFVLVDDATRAFADIRPVLSRMKVLGVVKVAYRSLDSDEYVCLWPPGLREFTVT